MEAVIEEIVNPVAQEEEVLKADSDAVVSVFQPELAFIGRRLSDAEGKPTALFRFHQIFAVVFALYLVVFGQHVGDAQYFTCYERGICPRPYGPNSLAAIQYSCQGFAVLSLLLVLDSVRRVSLADGPLTELGAGEVKISAHDARSLIRWRVGLAVPSALMFVMGTFQMIGNAGNFLLGSGWWRPELAPADITINQMEYSEQAKVYSKFMLGGGVMMLMIPLILSGWLASVRLASALGRDAVIETIHATVKHSPNDAELWHREVARPALALDEKMKTLSNGWGNGLLGLTMACWLASLSFFTNSVNTHRNTTVSAFFGMPPTGDRNFSIGFCIFCSVVPLALAADLAHTSSVCDALLQMTNAARMKGGPQSHETVSWLETSLKNLNRGQGLGFMSGGLVIDRRTITNIGVAIAGGLTTLVTALLALTEDLEMPSGILDANMTSCALSGAENDAIQGALRLLLVQRNFSTCSFNMTLDSFLRAT